MLEKSGCDEAGLVAHAMEIVRDQEQTWSMEDQALVFVPFVALCIRLAQQGQWHRYFGGKDAMTDKEC